MRQDAYYGVDVIIIDHFHLLAPDKHMSRRDLEMNETSKTLAIIGKSINCPVITLAQLSRSVEQRGDKRPLLSDLRECGGLEENAFAVSFLYRDGYYNDMSDSKEAEFLIRKNREGPTGKVDLRFLPEQGKFGNVVHERMNGYGE